MVILDPLPGSGISGQTAKVAQLELLLWIPMVGLSLIGLFAVIRRRSPLIYPVGIAAGMAVAFASAEGNFGTAYRHRAELIPVLGILAGIGIERVLSIRALPRRSSAVHG